MPFTTEECWTLVGHRRGGVWMGRKVRHVHGRPSSVAFDPAHLMVFHPDGRAALSLKAAA